MFHGVMVALEFLVLSVIVRIGVEQLPLPEPCLLHPRFGRALIHRSVYMTLLFFCPILCLIFAFPDFFTFLRYHIAHIENQCVTSNLWVVLGGALTKSRIGGIIFSCVAEKVLMERLMGIDGN